MSRRVCLIAFDSPDLGLLERTLREGRVPNLERLLRAGQFSELHEHQDLIITGCWITLTTGQRPTEHGLLYAQQLVPGTYRTKPVLRDASPTPPFWKYAGEAGLRSTVIGTYGSALVDGLPGKQVVGWGMHDSFNRDRWASSPPELVERLEREFGPRKLRWGQPVPHTVAEQRAYLAKMLESIGQQERALCALIEEGDWDFFCAPFGEAHQAGHWLWHHAMPEHPDHDPNAPPELLDALPALYERMDQAVGELWSRLPDDALLMLFSPYGLTINNHLYRIADPLLERGGLTVRHDREDGAVIPDRRLRALAAARAVARKLLPLSVRSKLSPAVRRDVMAGVLAFADVDWARTRAFALPSDRSAYVRINLAGREPEGSVQRGTDYDRACDEVRELFESLRGPDREPLVEEVVRIDRLFGGEPAAPLPDLAVRFADVPRPASVTADGIGEIELPASPDARSAVHAAPGYLAAAGPGIEPSGRAELAGPAARLIDVAPTVLAGLGVEPPQALAGSAIPGFVPEPSQSRAR